MMPSLVWNMAGERDVFLTFDDGPTPGITEWVIETLAQYDARATFFCLGKNVEQHPQTYARILEAGHHLQPPERVGDEHGTVCRGCRFRRTADPQRPFPRSLRAHHALAGEGSERALQHGDVGRVEPRLQPVGISPAMCEECYPACQTGVDRSFPRFTQIEPQPALCIAARTRLYL